MEAHGNPRLESVFWGSQNDEGSIKLIWSDDPEEHGG
jgi:hypothetical protein